MNKTLKKLMAIALVVASASPAQAISFGEIIGGVIGGGLGAAACRGAGANDNWSIVCGIGGALLGSHIASKMNEQDAQAYNEAYYDCAAERDVNQVCRWDGSRYGSRSGIRGEITPVRRGYHRQTREECRELKSVSYYGREKEVKTSIVCRNSNGQLYNLERKELFVNGRLVESETNERQTNVRPRNPRRNPRPAEPVPMPAPAPYCNGWNIHQVPVGTLVFDAAGRPGVFRGMNGYNYNQTVAIEQNGYIHQLPVHQVAIQGCHLGLTTGQYVNTQSGSGILQGIYQSGYVVVQINGWNYVMDSRSVYR